MINRTSKYRESIILLFSTLIISPIFDFYLGTVGGLNLWMVGGILYNLILIREIIEAYIKYKSLSIILIFTLSYSLIESIISENVLLQYSLFIISFNVFISLVSISNKSSMKLLPILNTFLIIICFYGIYQFIANIYNLPFTGKEIYRGRETADFVQISSFFDEPAFLALYLISMLHIYLYYNLKRRTVYIFIIIVTIILSMSLSGILAMIVILSLYFIIQFKKSIINNSSNRAIPLFITLVSIIILITFLFSDNIINSYISHRFQSEIVENISDIGNNPKVSVLSSNSSGGKRIIQEVNYFIYTIKNAPILGFGLGYENELNRPMGLNAIVEITVRWGLLGVIIFTTFFTTLIKRMKYKPGFSFYLFLILYCFIDGAISKIQFWLFLGFVFYILNNDESIFKHKLQSERPNRTTI